MASCENNDASLIEMDLEAIEIDENLLRELLEEKEGKEDEKSIVESLEESSFNVNMMEEEKQYECHSVQDFEWLNMMDMMMEPSNPQNEEMAMNWFSDDTVLGTLDFAFGYGNGECYSQICDGFFSNDVNYGCLWEDHDI